jgi:hypothetical protein
MTNRRSLVFFRWFIAKLIICFESTQPGCNKAKDIFNKLPKEELVRVINHAIQKEGDYMPMKILEKYNKFNDLTQYAKKLIITEKVEWVKSSIITVEALSFKIAEFESGFSDPLYNVLYLMQSGSNNLAAEAIKSLGK